MAGISLSDLVARRHRLGPFDPEGRALRLHAGDHVTDPSLVDLVDMTALKDAAVLLGLFESEEGLRLILTRRTDHLRSHAGQVALPGGRIDAGDASPLAAALREADEEIGLDPAAVEPLGMLSPYVTNSGYRVFPVVAQVAGAPVLVPNPDEVAEVFDVPLGFLMDPANHQIERRPWKGMERSYYAMPYDRHRIWGVTAGILRLFYDEVFR
ncbi:NUDIX hydrolase [Oryzibacter oryziterrae]|uniref:NUDIX hydrolase n=1 Tax=Oryzibacter oryziterrae TaxID=2766474 RepID=UPI001F3AAD0C|nr:CoA pyrophosphatase [Oryzibacter oryziterrae]